MTPGARVQAAIELLDEILEGAPAERALTAWSRRSRFAGSKDRAAVRDHVYQALRCMRSYGAIGGEDTGRGIMLGAVRAAGHDPDTIFNGQGHAPRALSVSERILQEEPLTVGQMMDLPDWLIPIFVNSLGCDIQAESVADALKSRAPTLLRVNARKGSVDEAIAGLSAEGITAAADDIATTALKVVDGARWIAQSSAYQTGLVELQDGSSQAAMEKLDLSGVARGLDYCAGGGGKVLALAARSTAHWSAHDALPQRMKDLPVRARRADVDIDILTGNQLGSGQYDLVLCDVPCSGSGTWRRTPDAKWRLTREDLQNLVRTQDNILKTASDLVAPGGQLTYATCSLLRCENEDRIAAFLVSRSGWRLAAETRWPVSDSGDGFFFAQLLRKK